MSGPRTIENTLAPFDEATRQLNSAIYFSTLVQQTNPDAAFRDRATNMTTKVSSAQTVLRLNRDVYKALAALDVNAEAHFYASFSHLAGYSSMYYTYMWDKVIAEDFFQQFDQANLLAGDSSMRYRRLVLEPGGSMSANDLVRNFLGRPQNMDTFQRWLGEEFEGQPQSEKSKAM